MKLLLDECVTQDLKNQLAGHAVATVVEAGFKGLKNGELLRAAADEFDVLITVDRNLPYQQNIRSLPIAVMVVEAGGITFRHLKIMTPQILQSLETIQPGQVITVSRV
jgi:predicted nuclease of predicted toxin-antitoxin system